MQTYLSMMRYIERPELKLSQHLQLYFPCGVGTFIDFSHTSWQFSMKLRVSYLPYDRVGFVIRRSQNSAGTNSCIGHFILLIFTLLAKSTLVTWPKSAWKKAIKALLIVQWLSSVRNVCKHSNHITKGFTVASHKSLL